MLNKVILIGNVGNKKDISNGCLRFSLATTRHYKKGEEWTSETEWHDLVAFGKTAEMLDSKIQKGTKMYVEGEIRSSVYNEKKQISIFVNEFKILSSTEKKQKAEEINEEDLPF